MNSVCHQTKRPTIICLTPIKNEAWILDRFLKCASLWADHIIIADQASTDGSREIALRYPKVTLIENSSPDFNEPERQKLLIDAARQFPEPRLLIALDADEFLTANVTDSLEWATVLEAPVGSIIQFDRAEILPGIRSYWIQPYSSFNFGFLDDGSQHVGEKIHSPRVPNPPLAPIISLREIKIMHYQFTDWNRMRSKHRWYQCWERLNRPERRAAQVYRQYHHMYAVSKSEIHALPKEWLSGYEQQKIDMTSVKQEQIYRWDKEVLDLFDKYGSKTFRKEAIWDVNWPELLQKSGNNDSAVDCRDPRNFLDKAIHSWLRNSQPEHTKLRIKFIDRFILRLLSW